VFLASVGGDVNPLDVVRTLLFEINSFSRSEDELIREKVPNYPSAAIADQNFKVMC
jgi:hypothetical protein